MSFGLLPVDISTSSITDIRRRNKHRLLAEEKSRLVRCNPPRLENCILIVICQPCKPAPQFHEPLPPHLAMPQPSLEILQSLVTSNYEVRLALSNNLPFQDYNHLLKATDSNLSAAEYDRHVLGLETVEDR
jgi:hypothetical protein